MRESSVKWESQLPKEDGEYLVTIQTEPYINKGNKTIFAKFKTNRFNAEGYGFTHMDGTPIKDTIVAYAEKPSPYDGYFAP